MKLIIKRDQQAQTGVFGGHKGMSFVLFYRLEFTPEEQALIAKYKAEQHPLTFHADGEGRQVPSQTVSTMMRGVSQEVKDITVLLKNEETITNACKNFKILLEVMRTFGGEEIIEL